MAIIQQPTPNLQNQANFGFRVNDYEAAIWQKGYTVLWEKALRCPCRTNNTDHLSTCKNCGSTGWVFINPVRTRALLSSINSDTKFKEWSEEKLGTVTVTMIKANQLSFMDRITVEDSEGFHNQLLQPKIETVTEEENLFAYTTYNIEQILEIFLFEDVDVPLKRLFIDTDYTYSGNKIIFNEDYKELENMTISIKYQHRLQYHVIDIPHETRNSYKIDSTNGREENIKLPINAVARRSHYVLDAANYLGDRIINNSYLDTENLCE